MKTFFSNNRRRLLLGGVINLLLLCTVITAVTGPSSGTHAQTAWAQQDPFSVFCYFYYHDGNDPSADADTATCDQQSDTFLSILKQETIPNNYAKWPQQVSVDDLAAAGVLINPQTETAIRTQQDFQASIPTTDQGLLALFQGDSQFLPTLWDYNSTYDHLPSCGTANPYPQVNGGACPGQGTPSSLPTICPVNPLDFQHSDIWPAVGPLLLIGISQQLQNHSDQHIDPYGIYGRLVLQDHCSVSTLAQSLLLNGQSVSPSQAYQLEQDVLVQIAVDNSSNTPLLLALVWAAGQTSNSQLDSWFSAAIISDPINPNAPPIVGPQPAPSAQSLTIPQSTPASVSVASGPPSSSAVKISIIEKDQKYYFEPPIVEVSKGTPIMWTNTTDTPQVIISDSNAFTASSPLTTNQTFQWTPTTAGSFAYHSGTHPYMEALIIVTS